MKPLNLDNKPCSPISSNCVVWQGPDIPCIELCTGDTVSDVVSAMATELCTILDTLKVTNYDLTCFNLQACGPTDFQALIQFLIAQICELQLLSIRPNGIINDPKLPISNLPTKPVFESRGISDTCPDCVVTVPKEFAEGTQKTMQLVDYTVAMGEKISSIITEMSLRSTQTTDILSRIVSLENTPTPTFTTPSFTINCQIGSLLNGSTQQIDVLLQEFINNVWCGYTAVTGNAAELTAAVGMACITDSSISLAKGSTMAIGYAGQWVPDTNYASVADAINNIWVSLCDIFNYVSTINFTITTSSSNTVNLEIDPSNNITAKVQDTGWVNLDGFDWYSGSVDTVGIRPQCRRVGNMIHFRGIAWIPLAVSYGVDDSIIPLTAIDTYNSNTGIGPATSGVGSMNIDASGVAYWNNNTRVIPASILDPLENLDGPYRFQYPTVLNRAITVGGNGAILNSAGRFGILSSGVLYFATLKDQEIPASGGSLLKGASPLRYITSNIRSGEYIPNFANTDTDIQNLPAAGVSNLVAESGFPTTGGTDVTWPITCDAAEESQIGGFYATLEGLTAFVDCNATTATTSCY